jgi:hypothetical protein
MNLPPYILKMLAEYGRRLRHAEDEIDRLNNEKFRWIDSSEVCQVLHISKRKLEEKRDSGDLHYSKFGKKVFYLLADIEEYLAANMAVKKPKP